MGQNYFLELIAASVFTLLCLPEANCQTSFNEENMDLPVANHVLGMVDINGDYRDDMVVYGAPREIALYVQTQNKGLVLANEIGLENSYDWTFMVGDYQNSGLKSLVSSGSYNATVISDIMELQNFSTNERDIPGSFLFAQGANSVDIDKDGYLDLFVCHDDADSHIYMNDGSGVFTRNTDLFDFTTTPSSDGSGNYGSIWTYIDGDDELDLYIAKCRFGATSTSDPRRINQLYLKDELGGYTRNQDMGLDVGWQSWTADFADMDNDGDLDCFIINHDFRHMLMENIDNQEYVESASFAEFEASGLDIQGILEDFDNDGLVDILVVGGSRTIFWNQGNFEFIREDDVFGPNNIPFSSATGDVNDDGFIDILCSYAQGLQANYTEKAALYMNAGNDNNYLTLTLVGDQSNREAVGARVTCYSDLGMQTRVISSGEGYGIVNSLNANFGLASDVLVDSVSIYWPSGHRQMFRDIDVNQHLVISESFDEPFALLNDFEQQEFTFCQGEDPLSLELEANPYQTLWNSSGDFTTEPLSVQESGFYFGSMHEMKDGVMLPVTASPTVYVEFIDSEPNPSLSVDRTAYCAGEEIVLDSEGQAIMWSTGDTSDMINVTMSGNYYFLAEGICGEVESESVDIEILEALDLGDETINVEIGAEPENIVLDENELYEWSFQEDFGEIYSEGHEFIWPSVDNDTTVYVRSYKQAMKTGSLGLDVDEAQLEDDFPFVSGGMFFDMEVDAILKSFQVDADIAGERLFVIVDALGAIVFEQTVFVELGVNTIALDLFLEQGSGYLLTTHAQTNIVNFGTNSPHFSVTYGNVNYPYNEGNVISITGNDQGNGAYYYFYNWVYEAIGLTCYGDPGSYFLNLNYSSTSEGLEDLDFQLAPNPATDRLVLSVPKPDRYKVVIYDLQGKQVFQGLLTKTLDIDVEAFTSGLYVMEIQNDVQTTVAKFVKQ